MSRRPFCTANMLVLERVAQYALTTLTSLKADSRMGSPAAGGFRGAPPFQNSKLYCAIKLGARGPTSDDDNGSSALSGQAK